MSRWNDLKHAPAYVRNLAQQIRKLLVVTLVTMCVKTSLLAEAAMGPMKTDLD